MRLDELALNNVVNAFNSVSLGEGSLADATGSRSGQLIGLGDDHAIPLISFPILILNGVTFSRVPMEGILQ